MGAVKSPAERQKLRRIREAMGLVRANAWPPSDLVEYLIEVGTLALAQSLDADEVGRALVEWALAQAEEAKGREFASRRDFPSDTLDRMMRL